jgi:signal transduction histidine kinase
MPTKRLAQRLREWLISQTGLNESRQGATGYGMAVLAVVLATVVRWLLDPMLGERSPHGLQLLAVVIIGWRYGFRPALVAVVLGGLLSVYFFVPPRYQFTWDFLDNSLSITVLMYLVLGLASGILSDSLRATALDNVRLFKEAKEAELRKDEFLAMISHELRNPLAPLRNGLYALERRSADDLELAKIHDLMSRQVSHLIRLVNDLLDVARITQGQITIRREPLVLNDVVRSAIEISRPMIDERKQDLIVSLPPQPLRMEADAVRLSQVIANLLNNAAKYTDRGGQIWLTLEADRDDAVIRVRDNGIGIAANQLPRIFDLFEQASGTRDRAEGGLGIGLTLVRRLVELHGGSVSASSPGLGLGTEFVVRLPGVREGAAPSALKPVGEFAGQSTGSARRVLVVDDNVLAASSMAMVITEWRHDVRVTNNGFSALEVARTFKPDFILADLAMPQMNGFELAREIRRLPGLEDSKLIAISGYGQIEDQRRALEAGFNQHLTKPIDPRELERMLAVA